MVYLRADRPDLAAEQLQIAAQRLPPDQTAEALRLLDQTREPARWLRLGDLLLNNGEAEAALHVFEQAERLGAPPVDARLGGSAALIRLGKLDAAEALLQSVLALAPDDAQITRREFTTTWAWWLANGVTWTRPAAISAEPPNWPQTGICRARTWPDWREMLETVNDE